MDKPEASPSVGVGCSVIGGLLIKIGIDIAPIIAAAALFLAWNSAGRREVVIERRNNPKLEHDVCSKTEGRKFLRQMKRTMFRDVKNDILYKKEVGEIVDQWSQKATERKLKNRLTYLLAASIFPFAICSCIYHNSLWVLCGYPLLLLFVYMAGRPNKLEDRLRNLGRYDDLRLIGPLTEMLDDYTDGAKMCYVARRTLSETLQGVTESDFYLLNNLQRDRLRQVVKKEYAGAILFGSRLPYDFTVSVLLAWQKVGNADDLPIVEQLAEGNGFAESFTAQYPTRVPEAVQKAAQECLPILRERVKIARSSQSLLRPSSSIQVNENTLLRVASPESLYNSNDLLHSAEAPD
jgi:hypothetical protein